MQIVSERRAEFTQLFAEFVEAYATTAKGQTHQALYESSRASGQANYEQVAAAAERGEDTTDAVLLKLLPYFNTQSNRNRGAWTAVAPVVQGDLKKWFENAKWAKPEDWPGIAACLLTFFRRCINDPEELPAARDEFNGNPLSKGFAGAFTTPILNAVRPDSFGVINGTSIRVVNHLCGTTFQPWLSDYPEANAALLALVQELEPDMQQPGVAEMLPGDRFDMYCHWLVAVRGHFSAHYWRVAAGRDGKFWDEWRADSVIGAWWDDLGDLTGLSAEQVTDRIEQYKAKFPKWPGVDQVRVLLQMQEGDRVVVTDGKTTALGLGTVTSDYYYDPDAGRYRHRRHVEWEDLRPRPIVKPLKDPLAASVTKKEYEKVVGTPPAAPAPSPAAGGDEVQYWKIAPGKGAWMWDAWREESIISIGWDDFGDISELEHESFGALKDKLIAETDYSEGAEQVWTFAREVRVGDRVLANRGKKQVLAVGTVTGPYYFDDSVPEHRHRRTVRWDDLTPREMNEGAFAMTIMRLSKEKFEALAAGGAPPPPQPDCPFSPAAFDLLGQLHAEPTAQFYQAHKSEFQSPVEGPFQRVFRSAAEALRPQVLARMEHEHGVFGRILKNDFGRGGAWDFYWGALYTKGAKRTTGAQLMLVLRHDQLEVAFYVGHYGSDYRERFLANCQRHQEALRTVLEPVLGQPDLVLGRGRNTTGETAPEPDTWQEWLAAPADSDVRVARVLTREEILTQSEEQLVQAIRATQELLYPLVLLAALDDPLPAIDEYLENEDAAPELHPLHPLVEIAQETGIQAEELQWWVDAINRKKQAILYGPPGTGKTFLARHLAQHLVGGGTGECDLVQFHPAYAYEDFIQGLRPEATGEGGLRYTMRAGRFLEFCERARGREGLSVLIIDEINRANLARVFGELMYLLEYRDSEVPLAGGGVLQIPENVRIIGTMNTADRSIALVDHALRRRFAFIQLQPQLSTLEHYHGTGDRLALAVAKLLHQVNEAIDNPYYEVGVSFFLQRNLAKHIESIWRMEIEPYLEEYFYNQQGQAEQFRWVSVKAQLGLE